MLCQRGHRARSTSPGCSRFLPGCVRYAIVDYASAGTGETGEKDEDDDGLPSIASIVEDAELFEGFFDLYRSLSDGTVYLRIPTYRLEAELIYTATVTDGVVETGLFRGQYRDNKMIKLQRHFNRIDILQPNTRFYFDPRSALSRAADANAPDAVLAVMEIVLKIPRATISLAQYWRSLARFC